MEYELIGEEVSSEAAIIQAAQAIDLAGAMAFQSRDAETMLLSAEYWTKLADFIAAFTEHRDKKDLDKKSDFPTGFQPSSTVQFDENELIETEEFDVRDDEDDRADEGPSGPGVDEEHGEFRISPRGRSHRRLRS